MSKYDLISKTVFILLTIISVFCVIETSGKINITIITLMLGAGCLIFGVLSIILALKLKQITKSPYSKKEDL